MSAATPKTRPASPDPTATPGSDPVSELRDWVRARVIRLQRNYLADSPEAVRQLAVLRRVSPGGTGDPEVWATLVGFPESLAGHSDAASRAERAAYDAIVLFAIHQQSKRHADMHVGSRRLGQALNMLQHAGGSAEGVERRFKQLGAATTYNASVRHLRSLVTQLRAEDIGLDYGLLARDLWLLQTPRTRDSARLRWGRDFYRLSPKSETRTDPATEGDRP